MLCMKEYVSSSLDETAAIAATWLTEVAASHSGTERATIVGLSGHLGAGKTAFVKAVAHKLGVEEEVTSPTFVIMKSYDLIRGSLPWNKLVHIDAYRLEARQQLETLCFEDVASDGGTLALIEWPENVGLTGDALQHLLIFEIRDGKHVIRMR